MRNAKWASKNRYRVWIVRYEGPAPRHWLDVPPGAVAVEPAENRAMTARQARHYIESFNREVCKGVRKIWTVAVPVTIRYEGDPQPGRVIVQVT
jgi:hypothetical protein